MQPFMFYQNQFIESQESPIPLDAIERVAQQLCPRLATIAHSKDCIRIVADALKADQQRTPMVADVHRTIRRLSDFEETKKIAVQALQYRSMVKITKALQSPSFSLEEEPAILENTDDSPEKFSALRSQTPPNKRRRPWRELFTPRFPIDDPESKKKY
jgi:hypothetical protein